MDDRQWFDCEISQSPRECLVSLVVFDAYQKDWRRFVLLTLVQRLSSLSCCENGLCLFLSLSWICEGKYWYEIMVIVMVACIGLETVLVNWTFNCTQPCFLLSRNERKFEFWKRNTLGEWGVEAIEPVCSFWRRSISKPGLTIHLRPVSLKLFSVPRNSSSRGIAEAHILRIVSQITKSKVVPVRKDTSKNNKQQLNQTK